MKIGTLTFEQAIDKLYNAHSIHADQLGEFVNIHLKDECLEILSCTSEVKYEFVKSQNETVSIFSSIGSSSTFQYMRMYTEDGDEMDFVLFEPATIIVNNL
jgi:hypothetical protein